VGDAAASRALTFAKAADELCALAREREAHNSNAACMKWQDAATQARVGRFAAADAVSGTNAPGSACSARRKWSLCGDRFGNTTAATALAQHHHHNG
jgi:hypothetical protein